MCLAQGHNAAMPVRLEPAAPRSRVKHSITDQLCSQNIKQNPYETRYTVYYIENIIDPDQLASGSAGF